MKVTTKTATPSDPWDEAFLRVESYLHAHRIESRIVLTSLATRIIDEARQLSTARADEHPVTLAMQVLHARMGEWFTEVFPEGSWKEEQYRARGRLALVLSEMPGSWAPQFLSTGQLPPALRSVLSSATLQAGPELRLSKLPPAPLEFGFGDNDDVTPTVGRWSGAVPALIAAALVLGAIGVAWATTQ